MKIIYHTEATATGGRDGRAATKEGNFEVALVRPKELGGPGGLGSNPEQLFAAGYAACFLSALQLVASRAKVKIPDDTTVTADVGLGPRDDGEGYGLDVGLTVSIPGIGDADAAALVEKAHVVCPYSEATRKNLQVRLRVV